MGQDPQHEENYTPCPTKIYHAILNYWGLLIKNLIVVLKNSIQLPWKQRIEERSTLQEIFVYKTLKKTYFYLSRFQSFSLQMPKEYGYLFLTYNKNTTIKIIFKIKDHNDVILCDIQYQSILLKCMTL